MGEHAGGAAEHLFISVAGPDRPWARWVAAKLKAEGFRVEYDEWDWAAGSSFVGRMDEALATANRMIAILSPHYFDPASYGRAEREAALIRAHEREGFLVPVRVSPCELTPLVSRLSFIDLVGCDEREAATRLITGLRGPRHPDHSERIVWPGDAPSPAPFPGPGPVGAEGNDRRRPGGGSVRDAVTVLHLPELRAGLDGAPLPLAELPNRVAEDVAALDPAWSPDLVVVTGDVAEHGLRREYETAVQTFDDLLGAFGLSRSRLVMVAGSRDVNLAACRSYFDTCEADEIDPEPPYWPKWRHFAVMIENFYAGAGAAGAAGGVFAVGQEWSLFPIDELNLVVAAMNSTMDVTHHAPNDRRTIGAAQEQRFASRLAAYAQRGWLRLGAVQEMESAASLAASLRHRSDLLGMLNLVLSGQDDTHRGVKVGRALRVGVPSGRHDPAKPEAESAPRYQLARVERDGLTRRLRHWSAESAQWADLGAEPLRRTARHWAGIDATLPDPAAQPDNPSDRHGRNDQDRAERRGQETHRERFVDRVAEVARLLHSVEAPHQVSVLEISPAGGGVPGYLRVTCRDGTIVTQHPVGVLDGTPDADDVQAFAAQVHRGYAAFDPMLVSTLVYGGDPAAPALVDAALRQSVRLVSFVQYQGLIDLRSYVADQTERLRRDPIYPPSLYLTQRFQHLDRTLVAGATLDGEDARAQLLDWMAADEGGLVLVLGDFGRGKTFLLHELARALPEHLPHVVPMLVELRHLEKTHGLDELLAAHLAGAGVPRFDRDALRYMLRNGRIVLLFDGFDELALRVTYERAAEHLTTLLDALQGRAKMVLTSRSQHFRSDHQVRTALAARLDTANRRGLIELDDFTDEQIEAFLTRFYEGDTARAADRLALIRDIHDLLGLSRNPRMLGFIARLDESRLREVQAATGTISSADLYRELIAAWLDYESARARPSGAAPALTTEDRLAAVTALAVKLWQSTERTVSTRELAATAGTVLTTLDAHGLDSDHAAHQVGSGTLLVRTGDDAFTFVHASVMEYLVATACTPHLRTAGVTVEPLTQRPVSTLMADFVAGLAGWPATLRWARSILADDDATAAARRNALALARRHHADLTRRHGKAHAHAHRLTLTRGAHLAGADLTGADLSGLDLTDADLTNADLTGATLTSTTLRGAHLASATLHRAALIDADLTGANLTDADCTSARFERCTVTAATIDGGDWFQAALLGCTTDPRLASNPELRQAALTGRDRPTLCTPAAGPVQNVVFSPDGRLVAYSAYSTLVLTDSRTGTVLRTLTGHSGAVSSVAFSPDGDCIATASYDRTARLWETTSGSCKHILTGHASKVLAVEFSPDGIHLATSCDDGTARLWDTTNGTCTHTLTGHTGPVRDVAFSPDGTHLATTSDDGTARLWNTTSGTCTHTLTGHTDSVTAVAFSPDGTRLATASNDGTALLWNTTNVTCTHTLTGHTGPVRDVAFSPDGTHLVTTSGDNTARLWNTTVGSCTHSLTGNTSPVWDVRFSPDGSYLAAATDSGIVRIWDSTGTCAHTLTGHTSVAWEVAISPNGSQLATASIDQTARLWDTTTGTCTHTLTGHTGPVRDVAFSPDGTYLATTSDDGTARLWNTTSGTCTHTLTGHTDSVTTVAFSPDGTRLATASNDGTARLWNTTNVTFLCAITGHAADVTYIAFSPDGTHLATASDDGSARMWDVATGTCIHTFIGHTSVLWEISFSPDGTVLVTAGEDGTCRTWNTTTGELTSTLIGLGDGGWITHLQRNHYRASSADDDVSWWAMGLCRFQLGELDAYVPGMTRIGNLAGQHPGPSIQH